MHGEIKLGRWFPFVAEQVIRRDRGMLWQATARVHGIPIQGFDALLDGRGETRWKLLGILPIVAGVGPDISRSAAGRMQAESIWLPSVLCGNDVSWTAPDAFHATARFDLLGAAAEVSLELEHSGRLDSIKLKRWGNPGGAAFHFADFGGVVEEEHTFAGYTIPTRLRVGWHFGTASFASEGEFFRVTINDAIYR